MVIETDDLDPSTGFSYGELIGFAIRAIVRDWREQFGPSAPTGPQIAILRDRVRKLLQQELN